MTTVAVIFGGVSAEHDVSIMSAVNVIGGLSRAKFNIVPIYVTRDGRWMLYDGDPSDLKNAKLSTLDAQALLSCDTKLGPVIRAAGGKIRNIAVDIAFPLIHGKNGEDGTIQGLCELSGLPYVGSGVLASALCMDKVMTRKIVSLLGIDQTKYVSFGRKEAEDQSKLFRSLKGKLGLPFFLKPANTGSSIGISKVMDKEQFTEALKLAFKYDGKLIAERSVFGRELECAILGNDEPKASPVGEILLEGEFYSYNAKYDKNGAETTVKPDLPEGVSEEIQRASLEIYKACGCSGLARADFFLEKDTDRIFFNEINTIPGFSSTSMYHKLWEESGMTINELCEKLIALGLERSGAEE
jgi:D-alanine-D-alanine ligase